MYKITEFTRNNKPMKVYRSKDGKFIRSKPRIEIDIDDYEIFCSLKKRLNIEDDTKLINSLLHTKNTIKVSDEDYRIISELKEQAGLEDNTEVIQYLLMGML